MKVAITAQIVRIYIDCELHQRAAHIYVNFVHAYGFDEWEGLRLVFGEGVQGIVWGFVHKILIGEERWGREMKETVR